eukprot:4542264-Pyramimonas_sp.AAC.1
MLSRRSVLSSGVSLHVDCAATVGCLRNLSGAAGAASARAHWWAEIGDRLEGLAVHQIPSHSSMFDVRDGRITEMQ